MSVGSSAPPNDTSAQTHALNDVIYSRWQWPYWDAFTSLFYSGRKWRVVHLFLQSMRNTQRLPDTAALTLLRLLKPHLLSLCEHFGGITQIFPHGDVDMWGRVWMSHFRGVWTSLNFDREYLFGFETLVFATSGIFSMHKQSKRKDNLKSHHMAPLKACLPVYLQVPSMFREQREAVSPLWQLQFPLQH